MNAVPRVHQSLGPGVEFDTIRHLLSRWGDLAVDIGDDAAVLSGLAREAATAGRELVVSTDACVEGVHFRPEWISPAQVGARAAAAALSDLAAMGAQADVVLCAFIVPDSWRDALGDVADGIGRVVRAADARIVGGNLSRGDTLSITTTVIGSAAHPVARNGAQVGDHLLLTGRLGGPHQAITAWLAGREPTPWARERFAKPVPRLREGRAIARVAHAMLDISDGLVADARHLAAASRVRLYIDGSRVERGDDVSLADALSSGEEYEVLAAVPAAATAELLAAWASISDVPLTDIGEVVSTCVGGAVEVMGATGTVGRVEFIAGHDHFTV